MTRRRRDHRLGTAAWTAGLAALTLLSGCQPADPAKDVPAADTSAAEARAARPEGIDWFEGDLPAAFEAARAADKPVFLYWGAVWCPSCAQIKATVMSQPAFIAKTRLFVPVYLDGDEAGAQKWAETFGITGYPSVVIMDPQRREILRIAGSMDLSRYEGMLDAALEDRRPLRDVLKTVAGSAAGRARPEDCQRLAWHGWPLEEPAATEADALASQLHQASLACPASADTEQARLSLHALLMGSWALQAGAPVELWPTLLARGQALFADTALAAAQLDLLRELAPELFEVAAMRREPTREVLLRNYLAALQQASGDARFARADQIGAHYSAVMAARSLAPQSPLHESARRAATARLREELARVDQDPPLVRSGVVSVIVETWQALDDHQSAFELASAEATRSKTAYYFLGQAATSAEALGRADALEWYARAYADARGAATRFQWGTNQLLATLRRAPDDLPRVRAAGFALIDELAAPDALYRRSRSRLAKVESQLRLWRQRSAAHAEVAIQLRDRLQTVCRQASADATAQRDCRAFLSEG
jgi:thiol-disulfide isomerase/thioredoxin